jgi:hypothetical protein
MRWDLHEIDSQNREGSDLISISLEKVVNALTPMRAIPLRNDLRRENLRSYGSDDYASCATVAEWYGTLFIRSHQNISPSLRSMSPSSAPTRWAYFSTVGEINGRRGTSDRGFNADHRDSDSAREQVEIWPFQRQASALEWFGRENIILKEEGSENDRIRAQLPQIRRTLWVTGEQTWFLVSHPQGFDSPSARRLKRSRAKRGEIAHSIHCNRSRKLNHYKLLRKLLNSKLVG